MENSKSDSSESSSSEETDQTDLKVREKRSVCRCYVNKVKPKIIWPPPPNGASTSTWRNLRQVNFGNPYYGTKMQLFSMTNQHLAVYPDGIIRGTPDENDLHTYLEVISAGHVGHVRIKGLLTNLYIAMDYKGRLYGEPDQLNDNTIFIESFQGSYNTYLNRKYAHLGWYIGIKKSGRIKNGRRTAYGQKAIRFLPRRSRFE